MRHLLGVTVTKGQGGTSKMILPDPLAPNEGIRHQPDGAHLYNLHWNKDSTDQELNDGYIEAWAILTHLNLQVRKPMISI